MRPPGPWTRIVSPSMARTTVPRANGAADPGATRHHATAATAATASRTTAMSLRFMGATLTAVPVTCLSRTVTSVLRRAPL